MTGGIARSRGDGLSDKRTSLVPVAPRKCIGAALNDKLLQSNNSLKSLPAKTRNFHTMPV
jgi:hypothetical protein